MPPSGGRRQPSSGAGDRVMSGDRQGTGKYGGLMPLWEVFIRPRTGLSHSHVGSVHASDEVMAVQAARDVYTRLSLIHI